MFYSKFGPASLKLYEMIQKSKMTEINCIPADNSQIRKRLLQNGITDLPAIFILDNDGEISSLTGKECFVYFDEKLSEKLSHLKENFTQNDSRDYQDINLNIKKGNNNVQQQSQNTTRSQDSGMSTLIDDLQTGKKVGRNIATQRMVSERQNSNLMYDDNKRTIQNENPLQQSSQQSQPQQTMLIDEDDFSSTPANIPDPTVSNGSGGANSSGGVSTNNMYANANREKPINLDDDPSGMGIPKGGGSPVSIAKMLEDTRGNIKIVKTD